MHFTSIERSCTLLIVVIESKVAQVILIERNISTTVIKIFIAFRTENRLIEDHTDSLDKGDILKTWQIEKTRRKED